MTKDLSHPPPYKLSELQMIFARLVGSFIHAVYTKGYTMTFGEAYRTPEQAALNAKSGKGIKNSLHCDRLALDFNLFKNGVYLTKTEDYKEVGEEWESYSVPGIECCWGGRFKDGNHISISYTGRK